MTSECFRRRSICTSMHVTTGRRPTSKCSVHSVFCDQRFHTDMIYSRTEGKVADTGPVLFIQ